jgi:hypothetical protein
MFRPMGTLALTALALTVTTASTALAGKPSGTPASYPEYSPRPMVYNQVHTNQYFANNFASYQLNHGVPFAHGFYYPGFNNYHWSNSYFHSVYGCRVYFDPFTRAEYYWCPPDHCFYPIGFRPYGTYVFP